MKQYKPSIVFLTVLFLTCCSLGTCRSHASDKPMLLLGTGYGKYERRAWARDILNPIGVSYNNSEVWVPPAQWKDYSIVMLGLESPGMLQKADVKVVAEYLENGGVLIATGNALSTIIDAKSDEWKHWIGADEAVNSKTKEYECAADVFLWPREIKVKGGWGNSFYQLRKCRSAKPLIQSRLGSILAVNEVGRGKVIFFGGSLFRILQAAGVADSDVLEKLEAAGASANEPTFIKQVEIRIEKLKAARKRAAELGVEDEASLVKGLQGMIAALDPLLDRLSSAQVAGYAPEKLVFWRRDPKVDESTYRYGEHALRPVFYPPIPAPDEIISTLRIDAGKDEMYHAFFNVLPTAATGDLRVDATLTTGTKVKALLQSSLTDKRDENVSHQKQECFWLKPAGTWLPVVGSTAIFWIQVDATRLNPGVYAGEVSFTSVGFEKRLPFTLNVWNVRRDRRDKPDMGFYSFNWLDPLPGPLAAFGVPKEDAANVKSATPFLLNQYQLGANAVGGAPDLRRTKLMKTGESLNDLIRKRSQSSFWNSDGSPAALDFSNFDEQVDAARKIGFDRICIRHGLSAFIYKNNDYIRALAGESFLSEKWKCVFTHYWREFRVYLQGKGFREFTFKFGDELGRESIEKFWIPVATLVKEAGWLPEMNPTGTSVTPEVINLIAPLCRCYTFNAYFLDQALKWKAEGKIAIEPGSLIGQYASWGYYKSPSWYTRRVFWESWAKRLDRVDVFCYAKLVCADANGTYNSAALIGWSQGWAEAGYLAQLHRRATAAKDSKWKEKAMRFLNTVVSPASPHGIKLIHKKTDNVPVNFEIESSTSAFDAARHELLQLLSVAPGE